MLTKQKLQKKREKRESTRKWLRSIKNKLGEYKFQFWKSEHWKKKAKRKIERKIHRDFIQKQTL